MIFSPLVNFLLFFFNEVMLVTFIVWLFVFENGPRTNSNTIDFFFWKMSMRKRKLSGMYTFNMIESKWKVCWITCGISTLISFSYRCGILSRFVSVFLLSHLYTHYTHTQIESKNRKLYIARENEQDGQESVWWTNE